MYSPMAIIDLIAANVRKTRNPFGLPRPLFNTWWRGAGLRPNGDALLFTGLMYQFGPFIEKATDFLEAYEDTPWAAYLPYARMVPSRLAGLGLAMLTPARQKRLFNRILRNIAGLLKRSGVDFGYRPELDFYSGILLYDLGDQEGFVRHARFVAERLKKAGVRKLITVDPHTTYALKVLFPQYAGAEFDVKTYFELVNFTSRNGRKRVVLHDPCFYGRYLELSDVPRQVLDRLGVTCATVPNQGRFTSCCGGPAESISPKLSRDIMTRRVAELKSAEAPIVAMCPICLGNLQKAGADVQDLATLMASCA